MARVGHSRAVPCVKMPQAGPVLLVDDHDLIRSFVVAILGQAGHRVLTARTASEGLATLEANPDVAVLLTDLRLPGGMDGVQLAEEARKRCPGVKVVVSSGDIAAATHRVRDLGEGVELLPKPYRPNELRAIIGRLLDG